MRSREFQFRLKLTESKDADIIRRIAEHENKQGYLKNLVRADIALPAGDIPEWAYDDLEIGYNFYCQACGGKLVGYHNFCTHCGQRLRSDE